ncbi:MAG: chemotaxis protein CheD [Candidatus Bathyarchaeia archaeon]
MRLKVVLSLSAGNKIARVTMPKQVAAYQEMDSYITIDTNTNTHPQVEEVRVDMAGMKVESRPVELLTSVGSCVGICLYDSIHRCGGLAHIMLPHASLGPQEPLPSKYADTAVPALIDGIKALVGSELRLSAKIAGGANMFANTGANGLDIGLKNVKAVREALSKHKIRLIGEDVGGTHGRRITFSLASGITIVRLHNGVTKRI